mmetsp:Transcript_14037/g.36305  ORF Transcript_14037/g.36305 Transcript_14037/m.36305 type:complete len:208 (-) Transcript_14037:638-1261(-)
MGDFDLASGHTHAHARTTHMQRRERNIPPTHCNAQGVLGCSACNSMLSSMTHSMILRQFPTPRSRASRVDPFWNVQSRIKNAKCPSSPWKSSRSDQMSLLSAVDGWHRFARRSLSLRILITKRNFISGEERRGSLLHFEISSTDLLLNVVWPEACGTHAIEDRPVLFPHGRILHAQVERKLPNLLNRARVDEVLEHLPFVTCTHLES